MARRAFGGRATCESYLSIDVREWRRQGLLRAGKLFDCTWARNGEQSGSIGVRGEADAVVLAFRSRGPQSREWESVEQRVPLVWTRCHLGGKRPWFICVGLRGGPRCGRRVVIGVSFGSSCRFRLRRKRGGSWERASLIVEPRSGYLLRGPARMEWQHSIPPAERLQYSATFRSMRSGPIKSGQGAVA